MHCIRGGMAWHGMPFGVAWQGWGVSEAGGMAGVGHLACCPAVTSVETVTSMVTISTDASPDCTGCTASGSDTSGGTWFVGDSAPCSGSGGAASLRGGGKRGTSEKCVTTYSRWAISGTSASSGVAERASCKTVSGSGAWRRQRRRQRLCSWPNRQWVVSSG